MSLNAHIFRMLYRSGAQWFGDAAPYYNQPILPDEKLHLDLNGDGQINILDLSIASNFSKPASGNIRMIAMSDTQLSFLMSMIRLSERREFWYLNGQDSTERGSDFPDSVMTDEGYSMVLEWLEGLKKQMLVDLTPYFDDIVTWLQALNGSIQDQTGVHEDIADILEQIKDDMDSEDMTALLTTIAGLL